MLGFAICHQGC